jgi:HEAT repeat protein
MAISRAEIDALLSRKSVTFQELQQLPAGAAPIIMDIFLHDQTPWNERKRRTALDALGAIGDEQAVDLLITVAENPAVESWLREAAIRNLGAAGHPRAFTYLEETAHHPDFSFRKSAISALALAAAPNARQVLEQVLATDPDPRLRELAGELLATLLPIRALDVTDAMVERRPRDYLE